MIEKVYKVIGNHQIMDVLIDLTLLKNNKPVRTLMPLNFYTEIGYASSV